MAIGDVTSYKNIRRSVCLMTGQSTANAQPTDGVVTAASGAVPAYAGNPITDISDTGAFFMNECPLQATLVVSSTAGSGVMTGTFTLWCYCTATAKWYPKTINAGTALAELATPGDTIRYTQDYTDLGRFDAFYLQVAAPTGTFEAYLLTSRLGY